MFYSSYNSFETRELVESVSEDSTVEEVDIKNKEIPQPQSQTVSLEIEDDKTAFNVVDEPIRWTFGTKDGYPSSDAVEFAEHIGIEKNRKR